MFFLRFPFFSSIFFVFSLHLYTSLLVLPLIVGRRDLVGDLGVFDHGAWGDPQTDDFREWRENGQNCHIAFQNAEGH